MFISRCVLGTTVAALAVSPAVAAVGDWAPATPVPISQSCTGPGCDYTQKQTDVATAPDGTTTVVWLSRNDGNTNMWQVKASTRTADAAAFGAAVDVGSPIAPGSPNDSIPVVAVAGDGTATVAWRSGSNINIATRAPGATAFVSNSPVSSGVSAELPDIAASGDGTVTVVWTASVGSSAVAYAASRPNGTADFDAREVIGTPSGPSQAIVAMTTDGATTAAWRDGANSADLAIRTRPAGSATWDTVQTKSNAGSLSHTGSVAAGSDGTMAIAWQGASGIEAAILAPGGTSYGATKAVAAQGGYPDVAVGPDGAVGVVWKDSSDVDTSDLPAGATQFTAPVVLSTNASYSNYPRPQLAATPDGAVTAVWHEVDGASNVIQARTRPPGAATYGSAVRLSNPATELNDDIPTIVASGPGNLVTATWVTGQQSGVAAAWTLPNEYVLSVRKAGAANGMVTSTPSGIDCGSTCSAPMPRASTVTLTATPGPGATFAGWSGADCSGSSTCVVTMNAAQAVTATFDAVPPPVAPLANPAPQTPGGTAPTTTPGPETGVRVPASLATAGLPVAPDGTVTLPLVCPSGIPAACDASGVLSMTLPASHQASGRMRQQASRTRVLARFSGVQIASGRRRLYAVRLSPTTYTALRRAGVRRVPSTLRIATRRGDGTAVITRARVWLRILPQAPPVTG